MDTLSRISQGLALDGPERDSLADQAWDMSLLLTPCLLSMESRPIASDILEHLGRLGNPKELVFASLEVLSAITEDSNHLENAVILSHYGSLLLKGCLLYF